MRLCLVGRCPLSQPDITLQEPCYRKKPWFFRGHKLGQIVSPQNMSSNTNTKWLLLHLSSEQLDLQQKGHEYLLKIRCHLSVSSWADKKPSTIIKKLGLWQCGLCDRKEAERAIPFYLWILPVIKGEDFLHSGNTSVMVSPREIVSNS